MRVKVLSLAVIFASVVALPVPASQLLVGTFSAPSPVAQIIPSDANFGFLLLDPFLIDQMSLDRSFSHVELDSALRTPTI